MSVETAQRFSPSHPCPICGGHAAAPSGKGERCYGFLSSDGRYAHCTREERAGGLEWKEGSGTYPHRLEGECGCGARHGDPMPAANGRRHGREGGPPGEPTAVWHVKDPSGKTRAVHVRFDRGPKDKDCLWRLPGAKPRDWGLKGIKVAELPLYRSEHSAGWPEDLPVVVTEGEKAADAMAAVYEPTMGTVTGASGAPGVEVLEVLRGKRVVLWADNDEDGRRHMARVANGLRGIASEVRVFEWAEAPPAGDAADHPAVLSRSREGVEELLEGMAAAPFHSSATSPLGADERKPAFRTAKEVARETPARISWLSYPWVAKGAVTEVDGKIKAAGKTTLVSRMVGSIVSGEPFLGEPTEKTKALFLTEQSPTSYRRVLERAGLTEQEDLLVLFWHDVAGWAWQDVVRLATDKALEVGAGLLVVDTLGQFAGIRGDGENNAGAAQEAMRPLQEAAARGLGVILTRHERKGGGEVGESARGSSAFGGAVDVILSVRRAEGNVRPTVRVIESLSRFDETPDKLVIELTGQGYRSLGDATAFAEEEAEGAILETLPSKPENAMVTADVLDKLKEQDIKRTAATNALAKLSDAGVVLRVGEGKKGNPYRYYKPASEEGEKDSSVYRDGVPDERKEVAKTPEEKHSSGTPAGSGRNESDDGADLILSSATPTHIRTEEKEGEEVEYF